MQSLFFKHIRGARLVIFLCFMVLSLGGIGLLAFDVMRKLDRLGQATSDNVQWTLSQVEVDYLNLRHAVVLAERGELPLDDLRRYFDIFYSRLETVRFSDLYQTLQRSAGVEGRLKQIDTVMRRSIPLIDGNDADLMASLPDLRVELDQLETGVRQISISGITVFASISDSEREQVARTLARVAGLTGLLVLALSATLLILMRAISVSEQRARSLRDASQRLQTIIATSLDAVLVTDEDGRVLEIGGAAGEIFERPPNRLIGIPMTDIVVPEGRDWALLAPDERLERMLGAGHRMAQRRVRVTGVRADGSNFPAEMSIARAEGSHETIIVAYLRDISGRIEAERALTAARDDALVAARSKAEFLAVMSHEMRTPLGGLLGSMENLRDTALSPEQRQWLDIMSTSGRILSDHVDDVLDIAKLEAGKATLSPVPLELGALLRQLKDTQESFAAARGNRLTLSLPDLDPGPVLADPSRLRQVLLNLVSNAIKFTENGEIEIGWVLEDLRSDSIDAVFFVSDTGIGIAPSRIDDVFTDFVTLDSAYSRASSGTGLGLGIVRRLVSVMGGEITVASSEGEGSRFSVALTLTRTERAVVSEVSVADPDDSPSMGALSLLLVEDNAINRTVVGHQLRKLGHEVTEAVDGIHADSIAGQTRFDLIFLDISMPKQDGMATARLMRARGANRATPIIALTAHAMPEEIARFHDAGMQDCLTKPVERTRLAATLRDWGQERLGEEGAPVLDSGAAAGQLSEIEAEPETETEALLDEAHLREMYQELGGDLFERLHKAALKDGDMLVSALEDLRADPAAGATAHRLAGTAASFGARRLHGCIAEFEPLLRDPATEALDRTDMIAEIAALWWDTRTALQGWRDIGEH